MHSQECIMFVLSGLLKYKHLKKEQNILRTQNARGDVCGEVVCIWQTEIWYLC